MVSPIMGSSLLLEDSDTDVARSIGRPYLHSRFNNVVILKAQVLVLSIILTQFLVYIAGLAIIIQDYPTHE